MGPFETIAACLAVWGVLFLSFPWSTRRVLCKVAGHDWSPYQNFDDGHLERVCGRCPAIEATPREGRPKVWITEKGNVK
jgi:hypothetical protein